MYLYFKKYLFIWLHWVFVAACGIFPYGAQTLQLWCKGSGEHGLSISLHVGS